MTSRLGPWVSARRQMAALAWLLWSALFLVPSVANAAGYFSGTKGARAAGRAGAFTATADDLSAVMLNPAGLSQIEGTLLQLSNRLSYSDLSFTRAPTLDWGHAQNGIAPPVAFATVHNQTPWQLVDPLIGIASSLGRRNWVFALAAYAPPGIARQSYPISGGQRYMMVSREAIILNYTASAAWRFDDLFGLGVSVQWIHAPRINYSLVIDGNPFPGRAYPVYGDLDMLATVKGADGFALNAILGGWYRPRPFLQFGAAAQVIPTDITTHSTLSVTPVSPDFTGTVRLERNAVPASDVSLTLPLPLFARAGVRYIGGAGSAHPYDIELNVAYESWSRVDQFRVDTRGLAANISDQLIPIGQIAVPKMWRDTFSVHLGGDYAALPGRLTLRSGVGYESAVSPRRTANVDFVSGQTLIGALGASFFWRRAEIVAAYEFRGQPGFSVSEAEGVVYQTVPGSSCTHPYTDPSNCHPQYLGKPAPVVNGGRYGALSHILSIELLYRF